MSPSPACVFTLQRRVAGPAHVKSNTFRKEVVPFDMTPDMLVKTDRLSLDPAMRSWLRSTRSEIEHVKHGDVMRAGGLGAVVEATPGCTAMPVKEKGLKKLQVTLGAQALDFVGPLIEHDRSER
ncbi:hypothetical protein FA95DRAFT_1612249 [Auriscalpium vulgare]|uniref:Uncharacterized protein n=1 Tax=Auriscalpium vulgare TaxID=40419 RepID=A0ACB8R7H5_9AGAM|nr:hypothetical protein FA95DRAFT_1612249 [Auriscalpium vulgare]